MFQQTKQDETIGLKETMGKINRQVSQFLDSIEKTYKQAHFVFNLEKSYVHHIILTLIAPVDIQVNYHLNQAPYFAVRSKPQIKLNKVQDKKQNKENGRIANTHDIYRGQSQQLYQCLEDDGSSIVELRKKFQNYSSSQDNLFNQTMELQLRKQMILSGEKATKKLLKQKALRMVDNSNFEVSKRWITEYLSRHPDVRQLIDQNKNNHKFYMAQIPRTKTDEYPQYKKYQPIEQSVMKKKSFQKQKQEQMNTENNLVVYVCGEQQIVIDTSIKNEIKQSKYKGNRYLNSNFNCNGMPFRNHSRFYNQLCNSSIGNDDKKGIMIQKKTQKFQTYSQVQHNFNHGAKQTTNNPSKTKFKIKEPSSEIQEDYEQSKNSNK